MEEEKEINKRESLNLQNFLVDMEMLGKQINSKGMIKPHFHYGDLAITNYLLWLMLGEIMNLNDKLSKEEVIKKIDEEINNGRTDN